LYSSDLRVQRDVGRLLDGEARHLWTRSQVLLLKG